jgi:Tol biopolymer transport system component
VTFHWPAFAPDGQRLAVFERAADGTATLVVFDLPGAARPALITFRTDEPLVPTLDGLAWSPNGQWLALALLWSPDGARIALTSRPRRQLFLLPTDGSAPPRRLTALNSLYGPVWSADGRYVIVSAFFEAERTGAIFAVSVDDGPPVRMASSDQWLQWAGR